MHIKRTLSNKHRQSGVSLIELMISIALGLLLLAAATAMTVSSMVMNADTLSSARLNQNLDSVMHIMVNDIRRAGHSGGVFDFANLEDLNIVSSSCVLYAYDVDGSGNLLDISDVGQFEKFGFKLVGSEIHMRTNCAAGTTCATSCTTGTWVPLTDDNIISISGLVFTSENSKCLSLTHPVNATATNDNNFWITTSTTATELPCMATTGADLDTYVLNASDVYVSGGTFVAPDFTAANPDRLIASNQVNIEITGTLANDPLVQKKQVVAINVRNYQIRTTP